VTCLDFLVGSSRAKSGWLLGCKGMLKKLSLSPGQSSKPCLEVFGLKAYRDLELQGGEELMLPCSGRDPGLASIC
jgi:hypothetical protein